MDTSILSIGNELTSGDIENTNASFISKFLESFGIQVKYIITTRDEKDEIVSALKLCEENSDLIIVSGGLGSTHDDVTKQAVTKYFDAQLIFSKKVYEKILTRFQNRGVEIPDHIRIQAYIPDKAEIIENRLGTAFGMKFKKNGKLFYILPGVPAEMEDMFQKYVSKELQKLSKNRISTKIIHTTGLPESIVYSKLQNWIKNQKEVKISILPVITGVDLCLTTGKENPNKILEHATADIGNTLGNSIYGYNSEAIEEVIGKLLIKQNKTLSTAESCTGGLIANRITNVSGSSKYFKMGVITYSNESKIELLKVKESTLTSYGAVSKETALEMAEGIKRLSDCNIALSTTGVAGPTGGNKEKPIGTVFIGLITNSISKVYHIRFDKDRKTNKFLFSQFALNQLRLNLINVID
jgi:nicotinamide-nucleotide amidase